MRKASPRGWAIAALLLTAPAPAAASMPSFVPTGSDLFGDFSALDEPRADVPVGALWVQGFGPHGEGAAADNLTAVRSLSGITINRDLQIRLTLGILKFLNIDPGYRDRLTARFTDLTLMRVKDVAKLSGPTGEPRIYEALKAAMITVTVDDDISLDLASEHGLKAPVLGREQSGRKRSVTLDGRDLFIAYRVVTPKVITGEEHDLPLTRTPGSAEARFGDYLVKLDTKAVEACLCGASSPEEVARCTRSSEVGMLLSKPNREAAAENESAAKLLGTSPATVSLPVPIADGEGGLFTSVAAGLVLQTSAGSTRDEDGARCSTRIGRKTRLKIAFRGERLETLENPKARGW